MIYIFALVFSRTWGTVAKRNKPLDREVLKVVLNKLLIQGTRQRYCGVIGSCRRYAGLS
jgi:hypothetical protein